MKVKQVGRRQGYAMLVVIVQMLLLLSLWTVASRELASTIRFIEYYSGHGGQSVSTPVGLKPLTRALILLETGDPPSNPYCCGITIPVYKQSPLYFKVTFFTQDPSSPNKWTVDSQSCSLDDLAGYPTMPYSF